MATSTLTAGSKTASEIRLQFGKREYVFESIAHIRTVLSVELGDLNQRSLDMLAIYMALQAQPALGNIQSLVGHGITFDPSVTNWGTKS